MWDLYFYKAFRDKRVEIKAGYISLNLDFIGLFVGGSTATGAQGVYAVLPYEAGMSYFPLTTPAMTLQFRGPNHTYVKPGAQRSIDPEGGPTEVERNHTGFRFIPHGDKLFSSARAVICAAPAKIHMRPGFAAATGTTPLRIRKSPGRKATRATTAHTS